MRHFAILVLIGFVAAECRADEAAQQPPAKTPADGSVKSPHDGVWKPRGAMLSGTLLPPPALAAITLRISDGNYEVTIQGEDAVDKGTVTSDESTTPKRMTIKGTSGPNKGKTILAIYEFKDADTMRVCYDLSGKEFPADFKAPKDTQRYLVGYRRQTSADDAGESKPNVTRP